MMCQIVNYPSQDEERPSSSSTAHADVCLSKKAVKLSWLLEFADKCNVRERGWTALQLVNEVINPKTSTSTGGCSFTDLLSRNARVGEDILSHGRPFYFVSHAWSRPFWETLNMLVWHFAPEQQRVWRRRDGQAAPLLSPEDVYCWIDVFAINQRATSAEQECNLAALGAVVGAAEETLLVLDGGGAALSRAWCLYEAWQSSRPGSAHKLRLLSYGLDMQRLEQAFRDVDFTRAKATEQRDVDGIRAELRRQFATKGSKESGSNGAAAALNAAERMATLELKEAVVRAALSQLPGPEEPWSRELSATVTATAKLCTVYGKLIEAESLLRRELSGYENALGADDPLTLRAVDELAALLAEAAAAPVVSTVAKAAPPLTRQRRQQLYDEAEELRWRSLEAWERVCGEMHPETLRVAASLGGLLASQRRLEAAEPQLLRALQGRQKILGPDHPDTLRSTGALATLRRAQGRLAEAEELSRQAVQGYNSVLGPDHPDALVAVVALASLLRLQRRPAEAEPLLRRVLAAREQTLGPEHPDTLAAATNLAGLLTSLGQFEEAEALFVRVLTGMERVAGPVHRDTLAAVNNLGSLLASHGRYDEAEPLYRRALEGREQLLEPNSNDTLASVKNLANLLKLQGKYDEAEALYRRALAGRERVQGGSHPDTLAAAHSLAALLAARRRYDEAEGLYGKVLADKEQLFGFVHEATLATASGLAGVMKARGKYDDAEMMYSRVLAGREALGGLAHGETLAAARDLATVLVTRGKYGAAEPLLRRVAEARDQMLGAGRHETLSATAELAEVLAAQGKYNEAEALHRRVLGGRMAALGSEHLDTLESACSLAGVLVARGAQVDDAEALYRQVLEGRQRALGGDHLETLAVAADLAGLLAVRQKYDDAELLYRRVLSGWELLLGETHKDTLAAGGGLAAVLAARGKYDEAEAMYSRTLEGREQTLGVNHPDTLACVTSLTSLLTSCGRLDRLDALRRRRRLAGGGGGDMEATTEFSPDCSVRGGSISGGGGGGGSGGSDRKSGVSAVGATVEGRLFKQPQPQPQPRRIAPKCSSDLLSSFFRSSNKQLPVGSGAAAARSVAAAAAAANDGDCGAVMDDEDSQWAARQRMSNSLRSFSRRGAAAAGADSDSSRRGVGSPLALLTRLVSSGLEPTSPLSQPQQLTSNGPPSSSQMGNRQPQMGNQMGNRQPSTTNIPITNRATLQQMPEEQSFSPPSQLQQRTSGLALTPTQRPAADGALSPTVSSPPGSIMYSRRTSRQKANILDVRTSPRLSFSTSESPLQQQVRRSSISLTNQQNPLRSSNNDEYSVRRSDSAAVLTSAAQRSVQGRNSTTFTTTASSASAPQLHSLQTSAQSGAAGAPSAAASAEANATSINLAAFLAGKAALCELLEEPPGGREGSSVTGRAISRSGGGDGGGEAAAAGPAIAASATATAHSPASLLKPVPPLGFTLPPASVGHSQIHDYASATGLMATVNRHHDSGHVGSGRALTLGAGGRGIGLPRSTTAQLPVLSPRGSGRFQALITAQVS